MSQHAIVAPSSAARVVQCPGSLRAEQRYPEVEPGSGAAEGEAAHWVLQQMSEGTIPAIGTLAPNGVAVTDEMLDGAQLAIDTVNADLAPHGMTIADCAIEVPVEIRRVHEQCWGTPDIRCWIPTAMRLMVWDYKFGWRQIEAFENFQLVAYAVGSVDATGLTDLLVHVDLAIIQPRGYHIEGPVRRWSVNAAGLRQYANRYSNAAHQALGVEPPRFNTGPECRDCRARHACATLAQASYNAVDESSRQAPFDLGPEALGSELRTLEAAAARLDARRSGLKEQALAMLKRGDRVPGWALGRTAGRRVWTKPAAEIITMGNLLGVNLAKPPEAVTPKQAADRGFSESVIAAVSQVNSGSLTVEPDDGTAARRAFG